MDDAIEKDNSDLAKIYDAVEVKSPLIFDSICHGQTKIQDCPPDEMDKIFEKRPEKFYLLLISLIEETMKCSGRKNALKYYYFTK